MKIVITLPTYNEKGNLEEIVKKIFDLGIEELSMIIVDDNSPDGTGLAADSLSRKYPIHVIHREKKSGLGTAYITAFKETLKSKKPDYILEIDADLSHNPADIPRFLESIKKCDIVLGSRYIKGGGIKNWSLFRKFISRLGNIYSRIILGLPYSDLTGGYKCIRREVLEKINLDSLDSVGYNFQIETTYQAHKKGFNICEIPIVFTERKSGKSKFNLSIIIESLIKVIRLRLRE